MFDSDAFLELLSATHNINDVCEPGNRAGLRSTKAAMLTANRVGKIAAASEDHAQGVLVVAKLFVEVMSIPVENRAAYIARETERGFDGDRHEFDRAARHVMVISRIDPEPRLNPETSWWEHLG